MNWPSSDSCGLFSSCEDEGIGGTPSSEDDKGGGRFPSSEEDEGGGGCPSSEGRSCCSCEGGKCITED